MFGRTARKGKPGIVQMVLHKDRLEEYHQDQPVKTMIHRREVMENERILGTICINSLLIISHKYPII